MAESSRAVFVSYASEDVEAAGRICEGLRAVGIEVWFDRSDLHGGDAWDRKIRSQIKDCALFIPIISCNSEARLEGYFRREWRLAVERTHDMADGKHFLLPVVIDETSDAAAHVPDPFRAVHWTRLDEGKSTDAFASRVSGLLAAELVEPVVRARAATASTRKTTDATASVATDILEPTRTKLAARRLFAAWLGGGAAPDHPRTPGYSFCGGTARRRPWCQPRAVKLLLPRRAGWLSGPASPYCPSRICHLIRTMPSSPTACTRKF